MTEQSVESNMNIKRLLGSPNNDRVAHSRPDARGVLSLHLRVPRSVREAKRRGPPAAGVPFPRWRSQECLVEGRLA